MKKKEKGQPGYIKWRKEKYLIGTIAEFAVVIALVVLGYVQTKTKLNLLTVVAVVGCLPASKMLVEFITIVPHQSIEKDIYQEIEAKASLLKRVYDLVITTPEKVMPVDAIVISGHTVIGYASNTKTDEVTMCQIFEGHAQCKSSRENDGQDIPRLQSIFKPRGGHE